MRLSKTKEKMVRFAKWCAQHQFDPTDVAELMTLCERRRSTATKECNFPNYPKSKDDKAMRAVETKATAMGIAVAAWPALLPELKYNGEDIRLPWPE